jgi:phage terminase large subunit
MANTKRKLDKEFKLAYTPRAAFRPFHQRSKRWATLICHRRAGKTVAAINELVIRALYTKKTNARFAYIAPFRQQAKMIAWKYLTDATAGVAIEVRESDLSVEFPNGAKITLYGSDNPDAMRGIYNDGVVVDEFADCRPSLWNEVILPTLADRKGWAVLMGTVKGARNQLWQFYQKAIKDESWHTLLLRADDSGIIDDEELAGLKSQMSEAQYNQEFLCDPNAALMGTFYTTLINKIDKEGHVNGTVRHDPLFPVTVAADLGRSDSTVLTFFQERPDGIAVIDCEAGFGVGLEYYFELLDNKPYEYDTIWLPHDARAMTLSTNKSTADQFIDHYRGSTVKLDIVPRLSVQDGIEAVRLILPYTWFNSDKADILVDALRTYRRKFNELTQAFMDTPLHSWESDYADSMRYLAIVANKQKLKPPEAHHSATADPYPSYNLTQLYADRSRGQGSQIQKLRV